MALVKCNSCGAEYRTVQRDGSTYFHACAPATIVRARREDGTEIEQELEKFAGLTIAESGKAKQELVSGGADPATIVVERNRRQVRRTGHRDENTRRRGGERGELRILQSEGAGTTTLKTDRELEAEEASAI